MRKIFVFFWVLALFTMLPARSKFNESTIKAELRKPGVKLVAIDFYMTGCAPCDAAIPEWKKLKKQYGDALKLIVVAPMQDNGSCMVKDWRPDKMICDEEQEIAESWGVKDFPQAFLYSWHNNDPLVQLGHVKDVEKAIKAYFKEIPRVVLDADSNSRNLVPKVEEALRMNSKIELVSSAAEQKQLLALKKQSHQLNYDENLKCELGKEISANSVLKITKEDGDLVLRLSSVEKSCTMAAATKSLSGDKQKLKTEVAAAVYELLSQMFGNISTPDEGVKQAKTQMPVAQSTNSPDLKACEYARSEKSFETWDEYLKSFPNGECSFEAKQQIKKLKKEQNAVGTKESSETSKNEIATIKPEKKQSAIKKIGNLMWSERSSNTMNWNSAKQYCEGLTEGGFNDWRLPTISELRTTIKNCSKTETGGKCKVSDTCLSSLSCWDVKEKACYCEGRKDSGYYSKLGDNTVLWSSSTRSRYEDEPWVVMTPAAMVLYTKETVNCDVRCVRSDQ